jgi:putative holliday junction resolvase
MSAFADALKTTLAQLPPQARLMGLDVGSTTIGIATSDLTRQLASPLTTIQRKKFSQDATALLHIAAKDNTAALIIGLPINMDGSEGPRAQSTRAFARNLSKLTDKPLLFWDERLSTAAVERNLIAADVSRRKRDQVIDQLAAAWILQSALDYLRLS